MDGKEKILAIAIALMFYFLAVNLVSQIFAASISITGLATGAYESAMLYQSVALVIIGLIAMVLGAFIKFDSIGVGLMGGAVFVIIQANGLSLMPAKGVLEKTILLLVSFIVLVAVAFLKYRNKAA